MRRALVLILLCLATSAWPAAPEDGTTAFTAANKLYEQGKYAEAEAAYRSMLEQGVVTPVVWFNLGNASLKAGQLGQAIAAYRRAELLAPRDPDVRANLQFARNLAGTGAQPQGTRWSRLLGRFTVDEWSLAAAGAIGLFFVLLGLRQCQPAWRKPLRGWLALAAVLAFLLVSGLLGARHGRFERPVVVVTASEAVIRRGPFEESQSAYTLRDGVELTLLGQKESWLQVVDAANRVGWVSDKQVAVIR